MDSSYPARAFEQCWNDPSLFQIEMDFIPSSVWLYKTPSYVLTTQKAVK
jgi:hypothetical protein